MQFNEHKNTSNKYFEKRCYESKSVVFKPSLQNGCRIYVECIGPKTTWTDKGAITIPRLILINDD